YPSTRPAVQQQHAQHLPHAADRLDDPSIDPYQVAEQFTYYPRWTGEHFSVLRDIVRAMCIDSAEELRPAWQRLNEQAAGGSGGGSALSFGPLPTVRLTDKAGR